MGMMDKIKNLVSLNEEDYDEEEILEEEEEIYSSKKIKEEAPKKESFFGRSSTSKAAPQTTTPSSQIQVVLVKPSRFEDAPSIADHLVERKTVVLNLEMANREISRRLIDFLGGTAYAQKGNIKKVAHSTYIITPANVDVLGDLILDDLDGSMYFE